MAQFQRHFVQELTKPLIVRQCGDLGFSGDNDSDVISVDLYTDGVAYSGGGTCAGTCICPDGSTVALSGSVSGKTASVTLTEDCFAIPGQISIAIRVTTGTTKTTVLKAIYNVEPFSTNNPVDPGSRISLDVGDLINRIDAAVESIPASADQLKAAMAPTFSNTTAYPAGAYVWNNGTLYRFTTAHAAGSWTGTDATAVALGNDVADLKMAIKNADDNITRIADTQLRYEYYGFTLGNIQSGTHAAAADKCYTEVLPLYKDTKVYFDDSQYRCLFVYLKDDETTATVAGFVGASPCTVNAGVSIATYPKFRIEIATKTAPTIDIEDVALSTYQVQDTNIASRQYVSDLVTGATSSVTVGQTGDYANLRSCFAAITPSKLNPYNVYIQPGEYDIRSLFSATERAQSGFTGLFVPDYVTLIGLGGKDATKLVWDGTSDTASSSIATLNFRNVVSLQGLTVVGKNIRYTIHDDFANGNNGNIRRIKDCEFVGEALTLNAIYGSGTGPNGGADWKFENCVFRGTNLICFIQHGVTNVSKSSYTLFRNCRFYGARGNEMQLASYNTGVTALNYVYLQGCKFSTALGTLGEIYMNEAQGQGIKYKILGYGNILDTVTIDASDGVDYSSYVDLI